MTEFIITFFETGPCEVDCDKVVACWNDLLSISQWKEEFRLIEQVEAGKEDCRKVTISKAQAQEIISKAGLLCIQSEVFVNAKTYRSRGNIISEKKRLEAILEQNLRDIRFLRATIDTYNQALIS